MTSRPLKGAAFFMGIGVDWSSIGWVFCKVENGVAKVEVKERFEVKESTLHLVDIPIGIPEKSFRRCDFEAKRLLSIRSSTIFLVPPYRALLASSYKEALYISRKLAGKGFPKQLWNIRERILEVVTYLSAHPELKGRVIESHPELCFLSLSGRKMPSKHRREGMAERTALLGRYVENLKDVVKENKRISKDVVDSCALSVCSNFDLECVPEDPEMGVHSIEAKICFPKVTLRPWWESRI